jgi:peptidoglycan-associated lipoprotein
MSNIFYEFGKWTLTNDSEQGLNKLVKLLNDNPNITIELAAHTDMVGQNDANKELSMRRAQSVVDYLIQHGIKADRLTPVGYGEDKPVVVDEALHKQYSFLPKEQLLDEAFISTLPADKQEICHSLNRRTEFRVLKTTYNLY